MLNPYHTYHMCHIKAQNMIDMTSMIATNCPTLVSTYVFKIRK